MSAPDHTKPHGDQFCTSVLRSTRRIWSSGNNDEQGWAWTDRHCSRGESSGASCGRPIWESSSDSRLGLDATLLSEEDPGARIRWLVGAITRIMAPGVNGEQLLQSSSSEAQAGDKLPSIGGVLCLSCGNFGCSVPVEDTPHFMAYLRTIKRTSRNFEGAA